MRVSSDPRDQRTLLVRSYTSTRSARTQKHEVESAEHHREVDRLTRERDRFKNLSSTLHEEVARLRKDVSEEMRKRITLEKRLDDVASEDVQNAVRVVEDIVNCLDDGPNQRELLPKKTRKAAERDVPAKPTSLGTLRKAEASTVRAARAEGGVVDIDRDFVPPDDEEGDDDENEEPLKPSRATTKRRKSDENGAPAGAKRDRQLGAEKRVVSKEPAKTTAAARNVLAPKTNKPMPSTAEPTFGFLQRKNMPNGSWRGGGRSSGSAGSSVKAYVDTIPANLLLGSAFTIPKLK